MTNTATRICNCRIDDIPAIQAIYAHHVLHGLGSFEEIPPDAPEMQRRPESLQAQSFPFLVGSVDGVVGGYAYAGRYRLRAAYRYTVEDTVYVDAAKTGKGLGSALLGQLIVRCVASGYRQMIAVIGDSANHASIGLHTTLGFERVANLPSVGFKHGRWVDSVYMQRPLDAGNTTLPA